MRCVFADGTSKMVFKFDEVPDCVEIYASNLNLPRWNASLPVGLEVLYDGNDFVVWILIMERHFSGIIEIILYAWK